MRTWYINSSFSLQSARRHTPQTSPHRNISHVYRLHTYSYHTSSIYLVHHTSTSEYESQSIILVRVVPCTYIIYMLHEQTWDTFQATLFGHLLYHIHDDFCIIIDFTTRGMQASNFYDSGRDSFLVTSTSKPPSKFDSIENLEHDVCESSTIACKTSSSSSSPSFLRRKARRIPDERRCVERDTTCGSSNNGSSGSTFESAGGLSGSGGSSTGVNSEVIHAATCWRAEVSRISSKPATAPSFCRRAEGVNSASLKQFKTPAGLPKSFFWGPKVTRQRQETERDIRRTNKGEPATFAM